jgi:ankyrin repeat protein
LTPDESRRAAKAGLFAAVLGADCGGGVPASSPRALLLSGEVPANLAELAPDDAEHDAPETEACAGSADMDPLLHVAVASPRALAALLDRTPDADLRDPIGKTPLMVAAQHDLVDSARLLLAHKAEVNTTTFAKTDGYTRNGLAHDARSPLMYAAASGSLVMIRLLLDAGADPYQADSKGARAIDYLLGYGPVEANRRLTAKERLQAAAWLF